MTIAAKSALSAAPRPRRRAIAALALAFAALQLAVPAGAAAPAKIPEAVKQFLDLARENFEAWDFQHKGTLIRATVEIDMQKPEFKGDAAAALAALKWSMQNKDATNSAEIKWIAGVTLADLDAIEKTLADGAKVDNPGFYSAVSHFVGAEKRLQKETRALFADGIPHLAAIRQGWDSDCYFNSGVGALALASPQSIVKLIKTNPDGTYTVTFPGKAPEIVAPPTDAEIAAYTDADDGVWFNVLEKAYAKIRKIDPKLATAEPLDAATLIAGSEGGVMALVSGHAVKGTRFPLVSNQNADAKFLQQVRDDLAAAFREHRGVVTAKFHHAFAVVAYEPQTDTVTIHNPYDGNGFELLTNGELSLSSGGFLSVSTEKFVENFKSMGVEQAPR